MTRPNSRPPKPRATALLGLIFVLLSAIGLAVQNVISRIFFVASPLFGHVIFGGFVSPQLANVVLILAIRMAMMALLLASLTPWLYPQTGSSLRALPQSPHLCRDVVGSSVCLFIGLICLYTALSQIAAGVAIAIFFIYPAVTVLLDWQFFHRRLPRHQLGLMALILTGVILTTVTAPTAPASHTLAANTLMFGSLNAVGAGLSFGVYGILAERCLSNPTTHNNSTTDSHPTPQNTLHPIPFSLSTFIGVSALAGLSLPVIAPVNIAPQAWTTLLAMTLLSATITLVAYVLNNFGIRYIGAALTALISTSSPALTAVFAWFTLQEALQPQQWLGIGLVTLGVATLSAQSNQ